MKRPWNIVDVPIYSLATYAGGKVNMNICTYVNAISRKPKLYSIGIDPETTTYQLLSKSEVAILQILHQNHITLIKPLGKRKGMEFDKAAYLHKNQCLDTWQKHTVLKGACAYLLLRKESELEIGGDHRIFIFSTLKYSTKSEEEILMFNDLVEAGVIL